MKINQVLSLLGFTLVCACTATPGVDPVAEQAALREAAESYYREAIAKNRDVVVAFYADDAMMIPPNADRLQGIAQIREYRFGFIETPGVTLAFALDNLEVAGSGDIGWTLATGDVSFTNADGQPGRDRVRDFHTWRKVNGEWKITVDMWNSNPPADDTQAR